MDSDTKQHSEVVANKATTRISVTFPVEQYQLLEGMADEKKVSVAWVVRDAVGQYLTERWPLLDKVK